MFGDTLRIGVVWFSILELYCNVALLIWLELELEFELELFMGVEWGGGLSWRVIGCLGDTVAACLNEDAELHLFLNNLRVCEKLSNCLLIYGCFCDMNKASLTLSWF